METVLEKPTIAQRLRKPKVYDEEKLFKTYHGWGKASSHDKLLQYAKNKGMVSTGKSEPSHMGPWFAMWRYAFKNPVEAYPYWKNWVEDHSTEVVVSGVVPSFEEFLKEVKSVVQRNHIYGKATLEKWCSRMEREHNVRLGP